jgi:hypothetical protein
MRDHVQAPGSGKLDVVREQQSDSSHLIPKRQGFGLEFDSVVAGDGWPQIEFHGLLEVRMKELEYDLRFASCETVFVGDATPQDESIVIKLEVRRIRE